MMVLFLSLGWVAYRGGHACFTWVDYEANGALIMKVTLLVSKAKVFSASSQLLIRLMTDQIGSGAQKYLSSQQAFVRHQRDSSTLPVPARQHQIF